MSNQASTLSSTTAQSFSALMKSARDIMRKDTLIRLGYGGQVGYEWQD
jgi:hypothetical protein